LLDFDLVKSILTNFVQLARGGQRVVYSATHPTYGNIVLKLFFNLDARSQREIDIGEKIGFDCIPVIYETGQIIYEGIGTFYI